MILGLDVYAKNITHPESVFTESFDTISSLNELWDKDWKTNLPIKNKKYWSKGVKIKLDDKVFNSKKQSLKLSSVHPFVVSVSVPIIRIEENVRVEISGLMKVLKVKQGVKDWHIARVCVHAIDKKGISINGSGKTIISSIGSTDWKPFHLIYLTPKGSHYIKVSLELKKCTGTVWFDNLKIKKIDNSSILMKLFSEKGSMSMVDSVIPYPMYTKSSRGKLVFDNVFISFASECDNTFRTELMEFIKSEAITLSTNVEKAELKLIAGAINSRHISEYIIKLGLKSKVINLGPQGYLLFVGTVSNEKIILLASNGAPGRYYALQTLKQLCYQENGRIFMDNIEIIDKPEYKLRGIVFGDFRRWYDGPPIKDETSGKKIYSGWAYRKRAQMLKLNFVWPCVIKRKYMVMPFPESLKLQLKNFHDDCTKHYIRASMGISPYRQKPRPGRKKGGVIYSSKKDIIAASQNLITLYNLGFKDLYIAFDDLPPYKWLEYKQDKKRFKNIGEAHYYYIKEVYKQLKTVCPDITFRVITIAYHGTEMDMSDNLKKYSKIIGKLPKEIEFVWTGAKSENADYYSKLCGGRKIIIWSNYFPYLYEKLDRVPVFSFPYAGGDSTMSMHTSGHFFLPVDLPNEDSAHISWFTAADYLWSSKTYTVEDSLKRALFRSVGRTGMGNIRRYMHLIHQLQKNTGISGATGKEKIENAEFFIKELEKSVLILQKTIDPRIALELKKECDVHFRNLRFLSKQYQTKKSPIPVKITDNSPVIDASLNDSCWESSLDSTDFLVLGTQKTDKIQTHVRLAYDTKNLYIIAKMDEPNIEKIKANFSKRDSEIFLDDCFEIFIGTSLNKQNYYHIVINSIGAIFDEKRTNGVSFAQWDGKYTIAVKKLDDSWMLEMAIPWSNFDFSGSKKMFICNFARERYVTKKEFSTFAPLFGSGFHLPQWFWTLKLTGTPLQ